MAKVNGYKLKEVIKAKQLELATVSSQFDESLNKFEDESKDTPTNIAGNIARLEDELSALQTVQSKYNLAVQLKVGDRTITLEQAVKMVGGAGRVSKLWRKAAQGEKKDYYHRDTKRLEGEVHAKPTVTKAEALQFAKTAESFAGALRNAIATGNTQEVELEIPEGLL